MTPKYLVIGSCALEYFLEVGRKPKDIDIICTYDDMKTLLKQMEVKATYPLPGGNKQVAFTTDGIYEFEIAWPDSCAEEILNYCNYSKTPWYYRAGNVMLLAPLNVQYMLKMSHRYKKDSPHFLKTMRDIKLLRKKLGSEVIGEDLKSIYERRKAETYTNTLPKLNQSKEGFFNDAVPYLYDHDDIHEAIKIMYQPAYKFFKPKDSEVMVSKEMWDNCSYDIRILAGMEEAVVLSLERSLIPFPDAKTPLEAFEMALMKLCTSISSGWFRGFCWENYDEILNRFYSLGGHKGLFTQRFEECVEYGYVKFYKE